MLRRRAGWSGDLSDPREAAELRVVADEGLNPYAPPAAGGAPPDDRTYPYLVEGSWLVVRNGARLPEVDLDGRSAGGTLTPVGLRFAVEGARMPLPRLILVLVLVAVFFGVGGGSLDLFLPLGIAIGVGLAIGILIRRAKGQPGIWQIRGFAAVAVLRRRARRARIRGAISGIGLIWALTGLVVGWSFSGGGGRPHGAADSALLMLTTLSSVGYLMILGAFVWQLCDLGWICVKVVDGWVYLRGVGPMALTELARRAGELPKLRTVKTHLVRLHRMPLGRLVTVARCNPLHWLWIGLLKLGRSALLERRAFHWSEARWGPPGSADAELLEWWQRRSADTPLGEWQPMATVRSDSPAGDLRVEEVVFRSPDRRQLAIPAVTRVANGRLFLERFQVNFRSLTRDGRILGTGDRPPVEPLPEWLELSRVRVRPPRLMEAHGERVAGEDLVELDDSTLRGIFEREQEGCRVAMEEAGIYGPVEEEEMVG